MTAVVVLAAGASGAGWAGANGMDGTAVVATFAAVIGFFGMLAWPAVTTAILAASVLAVMLAAGALVEAVGLVLAAGGLAALLVRRRIIPSSEPQVRHLVLVK